MGRASTEQGVIMTGTTTQDIFAGKTRDMAMADYTATKKALRARWDNIATLRGDAYQVAMTKYSADKRALKATWKAFELKYGG